MFCQFLCRFSVVTLFILHSPKTCLFRGMMRRMMDWWWPVQGASPVFALCTLRQAPVAHLSTVKGTKRINNYFQTCPDMSLCLVRRRFFSASFDHSFVHFSNTYHKQPMCICVETCFYKRWKNKDWPFKTTKSRSRLCRLLVQKKPQSQQLWWYRCGRFYIFKVLVNAVRCWKVHAG